MTRVEHEWMEHEANSARWLFPLRGPQRQVFVAAVEQKATFCSLQEASFTSLPL